MGHASDHYSNPPSASNNPVSTPPGGEIGIPPGCLVKPVQGTAEGKGKGKQRLPAGETDSQTRNRRATSLRRRGYTSKSRMITSSISGRTFVLTRSCSG